MEERFSEREPGGSDMPRRLPEETPTDRYAARDFSGLLGLPGLSDGLLKNHFSLYEGYVRNANRILEEIEAMTGDQKRSSPAFSEMRRRFGWEFNGIRLHELYFENLSRDPAALDAESRLAERIEADFGGVEPWREDFQATGAMRGIGWALMVHDPLRNRLCNIWIEEHHIGHLAGATPLLVMDVFEHAYMLDYGVKKADYIETFLRSIDWDEVTARLP